MATLIKSNGEILEVTPKDKKSFQLEELQKYVGGLIEIVQTKLGKPMIINEEGKNDDLPLNQTASEMYQYSEYDFIVGDVLICDPNEID